MNNVKSLDLGAEFTLNFGGPLINKTYCCLSCEGGMKADIFDSMAEGVTNAACLVCFMTQAYQDSANCALELKFARQTGVPIVAVMMEAPDSSGQSWQAGGWLGVITAGSLW